MSLNPFNRIIGKFYSAPKRFAGGLILNLFGYHILRVLFFNLPVVVRKEIPLTDKRSREILQQLQKDGIVVLPNFFPDDIFSKIKGEYDALELAVANERAPHIRRSEFSEGKQPPILEKYLAKNPTINQIVSAALGKEILVTPELQPEKSFFHEEDLGKPTTDERSDYLHFDVSYPTIKCYFYLTDTNEQNAPFTFVRGSHKLTLARLWMEYKMSISFYLWDKERRMNETPEVSRGFISEQKMNITPIVVKGNTLVIANTMGFHRRGDYLTTIPRETILINYRELESLKFLKRKFFQTRASTV